MESCLNYKKWTKIEDDAHCNGGLSPEEKLKGIANIFSVVNMNLITVDIH